MKVIRALVMNCGSCPFSDFVESQIETSQGTFEEGWLCVHKARRGYVLKVKDTDLGLRGWLRSTYGRPFPPDCPLPDTGRPWRGIGPAGVRDLDLQLGVKVDK